MFWNIVLLIVGMVLLIKGADFFVDGSSSIAKALKVPSLIIGLTLVSIGTSLPEASVSINASLSGANDMSIGNVIGSDVFNTFFILGTSAIFIPVIINKDMRLYDIPIMIFVYSLILVFEFVITPYVISRVEGAILLLLFVAYLVFLVLRAKKGNPEMIDAENDKKPKPIWLSIILVIIGVAGIIFGGNLVVNNASKIAMELGMSEMLVGLTIVAVGTSLPELVTSIVAAVKKENDIAIGNVVGSNIFNIIFILGSASLISPIKVNGEALIDGLILLGTGIVTMLIALFSKRVKRWHGILFILAYVGYVAYIIMRNYALI